MNFDSDPDTDTGCEKGQVACFLRFLFFGIGIGIGIGIVVGIGPFPRSLIIMKGLTF